MLVRLTIKNYALIRALDLCPNEKFSVITGETGAGKSIMLGALGLLLGNRADTSSIYDSSGKCVVEGIFNIAEYNLKGLFEREDLDYSEECIIRREITPSGKSRAFINDSPVNLQILKVIGANLVDIHSQNETLLLGSSDFQLDVFDWYATTNAQLETYRSAYYTHKSLKNRLDKLRKTAVELEKDRDYNQFLFEELGKIPLRDFDQRDAESELEKLENAEEIKSLAIGIEAQYQKDELSLQSALFQISGHLKSLTKLTSDFSELSDRLEAALIEIADIVSEITAISEKIEYDPELIAEKKGLLNEVYRLQQKHQVLTVEELLSIQHELEDKLSLSGNVDEEIQEAERELERLTEDMMQRAADLSEKRQKAFIDFQEALEHNLKELGMPESKVRIARTEKDPDESGIDAIEILFSANKGIEPGSIKDMASGGEYSRLMLAIKYLLARKTALPTIIFDEIDTGVSGEIAIKMTEMLRQMSLNHQVIAISHLPQFAAAGNAHFYVFKDNSQERSLSSLKELSGDERVEAIARMISGDRQSETAQKSARELMEYYT
jgi:DNA repair protein RecN (Recombination protein N)